VRPPIDGERNTATDSNRSFILAGLVAHAGKERNKLGEVLPIQDELTHLLMRDAAGYFAGIQLHGPDIGSGTVSSAVMCPGTSAALARSFSVALNSRSVTRNCSKPAACTDKVYELGGSPGMRYSPLSLVVTFRATACMRSTAETEAR